MSISLPQVNVPSSSLTENSLKTAISLSRSKVEPKFNLKDLEQLFRQKVLRMLLARGRITREMIRMMGGCPKSTFLAPSSDSTRDRIPGRSHCVLRPIDPPPTPKEDLCSCPEAQLVEGRGKVAHLICDRCKIVVAN
jgi:hypothetical protein